MIYTFYSYKGGVGRSMALANVAEWFYLRGLRVAMIDWDLEAPGLESFFFTAPSRLTEVHSQLGLMDALLTYKRQYLRLGPPQLKRVDSVPALTDMASDQLDVPRPPSQPDSLTEELEEKEFIAVLRKNLPPLSDFLYPVHAPQSSSDGQQSGALWLLPSGWRAGEQFSVYAQAVQSFDWTDFYTSFEGATYFEWMREQLTSVADVILIDSRTGVTEMGGVCTRQLADVVISFCVPNDQNLSGVVRMVRSFVRDDVKEERQKHGHPPPQVVVIPTRIENTEHDLRQKFRSDFREVFQDVNGVRLDPEAFWKLRIPYIPKYAYAEKLAIGDDAGSEELIESYEKLAAYLGSLALKDAGWTQRAEKARQDRLSIAVERVLGKVLPRSGAFLAYDKSDGATLASLMRSELDKAGIQVLGDQAQVEAGSNVWPQITETLGQVEYLVLIVTPQALQSRDLSRVCRYARQQGVSIIPIAGTLTLHFNSLPRWLRNQHFYNFDERQSLANSVDWKPFINLLHTPAQVPRVPFMAEELPEDFVTRPAEFDQLLSVFLAGKRRDPVANTAALCGAGGFGKTILARALCHDEQIQDAFDDGILWVTLGENPGDLTSRVVDLIYVLSGERPALTNLDAATNLLAELLLDRDALIVIDDVWNSEHLRPFTMGGPRCARLITTRNHDVISARVIRVNLEAMQRDEAVSLLGAGLPSGSEADLSRLATRLGEWPLLLKLVNSALRERVSGAGQRLTDALDFVNTALDRRGLTFFDARNPIAREQAVSKTIDLSLQHLTEVERERFIELGVFPEDADIPLTTIAKLWGATGRFDEFDTEELCERLARLSLLLRFDPSNRFVRLHDVVRAYLLTLMPGVQLIDLHSKLLDAHRTTKTPSWAAMSSDEPYLWDHLAFHLTGAGLYREFLVTVLSLDYLIGKTNLRGTRAVEADFRIARNWAPQNRELTSLLHEYSRMTHILNRIDTQDELATTLYSRLQHLKELAPLTSQLESTLTRPYLAPWRLLPDLPAASLVRTFAGHRSRVNGCAFAADGSFIVSASDDKTLKVWDVTDGSERFTLEGHLDGVTGCAVSRDGSFLVSASSDHTLKVWDLLIGRERMTLRGHTDSVTGCAISPDGSLLVSASADHTLKVWDLLTGHERMTLRGHSDGVTGCAISPDGSLLVSVSVDRTLRFWSAHSGAELNEVSWNSDLTACAFSPDGSVVVCGSSDRTLKVYWVGRPTRDLKEGHLKRVNGCAISPDSSFVVSASSDQTLKLWDLKSGAERSTLRGHTAWVKGCAISPDGARIVSASNDQTLKIWDAEAQVERSAPVGHTAWVRACAVNRDGTLLISASDDRKLKGWDVSSGNERLTLKGHQASVRDCAVSPDDSFIVSSSSDRTLRVHTKKSSRNLTLRGHTDTVNGCAISPDNSFIVSASSDMTLKIWDALDCQNRLTLSGHTDAVHGCAITPDGTSIVSVSADRTLKVWNASDGTLTKSFSGHTGAVNDCVISKDGSVIISASADRTVKMWDAASGELIRSLEGHAASVSACAINSQSTLIASVSWDRTLKVWDAGTGICFTTFHAEGVLLDCAWIPNSQYVVAVGGGGIYWLRLIAE